MSAGDVLFVGWTGGDPKYKELPASYQVEPAEDPEYIRKRVQISRICLQKDEQATIQNMPTGEKEIISSYIDSDGSAKTKSFGSGFTLLNISRAGESIGFSRITAVYEKTVHKIFEIGLPEGLSIECSQGKAQIKYNDTVLEEIDSGDGECREGLSVDIYRAWIPDFFERPIISSQRITPPSANYRPFYGVDLKINDTVVDRVLLFGKNVPQREFLKSSKSFNYDTKTFRQGGDPESESFDQSQILSDRQQFIDDNRFSQQDLNDIAQIYRNKYRGDEFTALSVSANQEIDWDITTTPKTVIETEAVQTESVIYNVEAIATGVTQNFTPIAFAQNQDLLLQETVPSEVQNINEVPSQLLYENIDPSSFEYEDYYRGPYELQTAPYTNQVSSIAILYRTQIVEIPTTVTEYVQKEVEKIAFIFYKVSMITSATVEATFNLPSRGYVPKVRWNKSGNVIKLMFGELAIREYDVTGL